MSTTFLTDVDKAKFLSEALDPEKVLLVCGIHKWSPGSKDQRGKPVPPNFKCKQCQFASFMSLLAHIPANKRYEVLEMLEYSTRKLIEADKRGELNAAQLYKHPKVTVTKE